MGNDNHGTFLKIGPYIGKILNKHCPILAEKGKQ